MKVFKKVLKVFLVLLIAATWLNIGYWGGKSYVDGAIKLSKNEPLNNFQKFQHCSKFSSSIKDPFVFNAKMDTIASLFLWPVGLLAILIAWATYGVIQGTIGFWHGIVFLGSQIWHILMFLWNFFFCGGFFKLLGTIGYYWILTMINFLAAALLINWGYRIQRDYDRASCGMAIATAPSIVCGIIVVSSLIVPPFVNSIWWCFYILWSTLLAISLVFNIIFKK